MESFRIKKGFHKEWYKGKCPLELTCPLAFRDYFIAETFSFNMVFGGSKGRAFSEIHLLLCRDLSQLRIAAAECVENTAPAGAFTEWVAGCLDVPGS